MNEKDKLAWERACDALYGFGYSEQFSMALWQAALEYARQPAQAEPVAKATVFHFERDGKMYQTFEVLGIHVLDDEQLLYTEAPAVAVNEQLLQTVKHILGWRELRNGNEFPVRRIEEMCEAAVAAAEASKKGGV